MNKALDPRTTGEALLPALLDEIRARRDEFEKLTYVPLDMVGKLQAVGAYRAFVPKELGGDARSPAEFCRLMDDVITRLSVRNVADVMSQSSRREAA